ncbi:MAG: hypothetical protein MJZ72_05065 [Bacteroidales bacterium]|nr:hypothetical protein [Bacteroidales bacterium]
MRYFLWVSKKVSENGIAFQARDSNNAIPHRGLRPRLLCCGVFQTPQCYRLIADSTDERGTLGYYVMLLFSQNT